MKNTCTIKGLEAIRLAERDNLTLSKYADPTEDWRTDLTADEAREVAKEDAGLIYVTVEPIGWTDGDGSGHEGYNVSDYFRGEKYLGPDECGIEPTFADA